MKHIPLDVRFPVVIQGEPHELGYIRSTFGARRRFTSLNMSLTHYATGTAPIIFGSGHATLNEWWIAGFVMSVVNTAILVVVGGVWWTMLGYL